MKCPTCGTECNACRRGDEFHPYHSGLRVHAHWVGDGLKTHTWAEWADEPRVRARESMVE
jgi:hypothetical protein